MQSDFVARHCSTTQKLQK